MAGTSFLFSLLSTCMVLTTGVDAIPFEDFYPFGSEVGDANYSNVDDGASPPISLLSQLNFFGQFYNDTYVNSNGNISPGDPFTAFSPREFPKNTPLLAVYWADSDTEPEHGGSGTVWYRITSTETLLQRALTDIRRAYPSVSSIDFLLIATWDHLGYFVNEGELTTSKTNTFQCVLAIGGTQSYAIYLYADGLIQWTTGDSSGGMGGLGGNPALVGYTNTTITSYTVPGSQRDVILRITSTTNVDVAGMWVFRLDEEELVLPNCDKSILECGFCSYDEDSTTFGVYIWPETRGGRTISLPCQLDSTINVTRDCLNDGTWNEPAYDDCRLLILRDEINEDNLDETAMAVASAVQGAKQTAGNAQLVRDVIVSTAMFAINDSTLIDEELVGNIVDVLNGLQQWPADAVQADDNGAEIVESFEIIAIRLALQESFTKLTITNENIAASIRSVNFDDIKTGMSLSVPGGEGSLNATIGNDSTLGPDEIASGFLPLSLFDLFDSNEESVPIVFAVLRSGSLFSIEGNQGNVDNLETSVGSPVVSLTAGSNRTFRNLPEPVIVNVRIQVQNFMNPRCVSYDFDQQVWVTDGCTTIQTSESNLITCKCDHLTNFATLVDICSRTDDDGCGQSYDARLALDVISIIGVILSGGCLILTILTLLIFTKLRRRDASKFHVQLSLALLGMLVVFVVGIDRADVFEGCVTVSVLIHYFTLVSVMWMGAEAVLMFQKLVIIFVQITTRYIIIVSLVCWLVPIIPAVIPAAIDPDLVVTDTHTNKFCFIGDDRVFFAAFLGPIFAILLFNAVILIIIILVLIRNTRNKLDKIDDARQQRKSNIRLAVSLFGIMTLFGLTWVLGAFTISEASLRFQILFAIFNSLQGLFIFSHFCALSDDVRQLWLEKLTCGHYGNSKSSYIGGGTKNHSTGQVHSGVKEKTLTYSTSLPSAHDVHVYESRSTSVVYETIGDVVTSTGPGMSENVAYKITEKVLTTPNHVYDVVQN